jgi:hypothetical protein
MIKTFTVTIELKGTKNLKTIKGCEKVSIIIPKRFVATCSLKGNILKIVTGRSTSATLFPTNILIKSY